MQHLKIPTLWQLFMLSKMCYVHYYIFVFCSDLSWIRRMLLHTVYQRFGCFKWGINCWILQICALDDLGVQIPVVTRDFSVLQNVQTKSGAHPGRVLSLGWSSCSLKLATHLHLVLRLRMSGTLPLFTTCVFLHGVERENFTFI